MKPLGRALLLRAATDLKPDLQGKLDGLCGLYAVLNGIQIVLYPTRKLSQRERRHLFAHGIAALQRSRLLASVLTGGMARPTWERLCRTMLAEASALLDVDIRAQSLVRDEPDIGDRQALRWIHRNLKDGAPVLITLFGALNHSTVVIGHTKSRLILFDSSGLRWVAVRSVGIDPASSRHWFDPRYVFAIRPANP